MSSKKSGSAFSIISVGRKRTGKTTHTKKILDGLIDSDPNREIYIFDINREFLDYYEREFLSFEDFMNLIEPIKNSIIHFEEATIFFESRSTNKIIMDKLVRARHQNNFISMNFHAWGLVPRQIFALVDFVNIFKTNDTELTVKQKVDNPKIINAFKEVQKSDDNFKRITVDLYGQ